MSDAENDLIVLFHLEMLGYFWESMSTSSMANITSLSNLVGESLQTQEYVEYVTIMNASTSLIMY